MQSGLKPLGRERWWVLFLLAPTLVGLLVGTFGSILGTLIISFLKWDLISAPEWVGLQNYQKLPGDDLFIESLQNTVAFSLLYVPLVILFSLGLAMLLNRKIRGVSFFRVVYFLPVVSSAVAVGLIWLWIFAKDVGLLNGLLNVIGIESIRWLNPRNVMYSVVIVNVWGAVGEGMIIFLAGLQAIPRDFYEAAQVDGARSWHLIRYITMPLVAPSIFFQAIISTINAFQAFEYIYILTRTGSGSSNLPTLVFSIYRNGFDFFRMGTASAQAIVLAVIIFALTLVYFQIQRRWVVYG